MKIQDYLQQEGVQYEVHQHSPAYTAQEVAAEEHVSGKLLAKPVIVRTDSGFAMCVLDASHKLDMSKVIKVLSAKSARLADESEMATLFPDSEVGAEPPFGNLYDLPTIVDTLLARDGDIVFQAGTHSQTIRMRYESFASVANPQVADLAMQL